MKQMEKRNRTVVNSHQFSSFIAVNECFRKKFAAAIKDPKQCFMWHMWKCFFAVYVLCVCCGRVSSISPSLSIFDTPLKITMPKSEVNQQVVISFDYFFYCDCFGNCDSSVSFPSFHRMPNRRWPKPTLGPFCVPSPLQLYLEYKRVKRHFLSNHNFSKHFHRLLIAAPHYLFFAKYGKVILLNKTHD